MCITQFHLISFCNVTSKIVTKVIANRLKGWLNSIISLKQSAFILGRLIIDNVVVRFGCIHSIQGRRKRKKIDMVLKLDMSKAHDHVEWVFLKRIMEKMGFDERWIGLIIQCITC